jgi:succinate-semialdehyde dehydrogenase/glutarate-semialdehyde dehydrogenase
VAKKIRPSASVWDLKSNFGSLYSSKGVEKVQRHVDDAVSRGAKVILGGKADHSYGSNFYPPTIITGSKSDMLFYQEETFGPVACLIPFSTQEEVIQMANGVDVGLAGYLFTENIKTMWDVAEALQVGMVGCRIGLISACEQPFSVVKESG